jgi:hypothetical protein
MNILPTREEDVRLNAEPVVHTPLCAWCLAEQGIPASEGSHGICRKHADQLLLQQRKLHGRRIATRS